MLSGALQLLLFPCHYFIPLLSHLCAPELQLVKSLMRNIPLCLTQPSTLLLSRESLKVFCRAKEQPQDWKRSVFFSIPKKGNAKECSNYCTIVLISHTSKVMLKILQARLQQYVNCEFPHVQTGFRKGRGTRDQIASICWIIEKQEFQKNIYFFFIDCAKAFDCVDHNKLENSSRAEKSRLPDLPPEKSVCRSRRNS